MNYQNLKSNIKIIFLKYLMYTVQYSLSMVAKLLPHFSVISGTSRKVRSCCAKVDKLTQNYMLCVTYRQFLIYDRVENAEIS